MCVYFTYRMHIYSCIDVHHVFRCSAPSRWRPPLVYSYLHVIYVYVHVYIYEDVHVYTFTYIPSFMLTWCLTCMYMVRMYINTYTYVLYIMPALCTQLHLLHIPIYRHLCIHRITWFNKVLLKSNPKLFKSNPGLFWWNLYASKCSVDRILGSFGRI